MYSKKYQKYKSNTLRVIYQMSGGDADEDAKEAAAALIKPIIARYAKTVAAYEIQLKVYESTVNEYNPQSETVNHHQQSRETIEAHDYIKAYNARYNEYIAALAYFNDLNNSYNNYIEALEMDDHVDVAKDTLVELYYDAIKWLKDNTVNS